MRMSFRLSLVTAVTFCAVIPSGAGFAAPAPVVLSNTAADASVPSSAPLNAPRKLDVYWEVKQPQLPPGFVTSSANVPCLMTKTQGPGMTVQISAGGYSIGGFGFASPSFSFAPGSSVPVSVVFDQQSGPFVGTGVASGANMIVLNVTDGKKLYDRVGATSVLTVSAGEAGTAKTVRYDLAGIRTALADAENCRAQSGGSASAPKVESVAVAPAIPSLVDTPRISELNAPSLKISSTQASTPRDVLGVGRPVPTLKETVNIPASKPDAAQEVPPGASALPVTPVESVLPGTPSTPVFPAAKTNAPDIMGAIVWDAPTSEKVIHADTPDAPVITPKTHQIGDGSAGRLEDLPEIAVTPLAAGSVEEDGGRAVPPPPIAAPVVSVVPGVVPPSVLPVVSIAEKPVPVMAEAPVGVRPQLLISSDLAPVSAPQPEPRIQVPVKVVETFRARKGESFRDVVRRWSARSGVDLVWNMPTDIIIEHEFSYVGNFNTALDMLVKQYPESGIKTTFAPEGVGVDKQPFVAESQAPKGEVVSVPGADLVGIMQKMPADGVQQTVQKQMIASPPAAAPVVHPQPVQDLPAEILLSNVPGARNNLPQPVLEKTPVIPSPAPVAAPVLPGVIAATPAPAVSGPVGPVQRWRALQGASIHQVMQVWAEEAGYAFVWAGQQDFSVRYSVNQSSDFGRAVSDLLGQYIFEPMRPVGQIYQDPATGQKTLVVRVMHP